MFVGFCCFALVFIVFGLRFVCVWFRQLLRVLVWGAHGIQEVGNPALPRAVQQGEEPPRKKP